MSPMLKAVVAFLVCFTAGTALQHFLMGREQMRRNVIVGVFTSLVVALFVYLFAP